MPANTDPQGIFDDSYESPWSVPEYKQSFSANPVSNTAFVTVVGSLSTNNDFLADASDASGGTTSVITYNGVQHNLHVFNQSDDFYIPVSATVNYLIVGGGGAGNRGGGGAGGLRTNLVGYRSGRDSDPEPTMTLDAGTYSVVVGAGGTAPDAVSSGEHTPGYGEDSSFNGIVAAGGGVGGGGGDTGAQTPGYNGGSGGGAGSTYQSSNLSGGTGIAGQGFNGGNSRGYSVYETGGGGGTGGAGANAGGSDPGDGGVGTINGITGTDIYYGGGGGGSAHFDRSGVDGAPGGLGGGGTGGPNASAGTDGLGGGGGAGGIAGNSASFPPGDGGDGVVIISYPSANIGLTETESANTPVPFGITDYYATGWSDSNYLHINGLDTLGSCSDHTFIAFYRGTSTANNASSQVAIPIFGNKDSSTGLMFGIDGGKIAVSDGTNIYRGSTFINDNAWQRLIFVCTSNTVVAYTEGTEEINQDVGSSIVNNSKINAIGHGFNTSTHPEALDGIQIYSTPFSTLEVADWIDNSYSAYVAPTLGVENFLSGKTTFSFFSADTWSGTGSISDTDLGSTWTPSGVTKVTVDGFEAFNFDSGYMTTSTSVTVPNEYTFFYLVKWRASNSGWRTGYRPGGQHQLIVNNGATDLGMYSASGQFRDTGYNITPDTWARVIVTGIGTSGYDGTQTFYVDGTNVGTTDRVASNFTMEYFGYPGQGIGKVIYAGGISGQLTTAEIAELDSIMASDINESEPVSNTADPRDYGLLNSLQRASLYVDSNSFIILESDSANALMFSEYTDLSNSVFTIGGLSIVSGSNTFSNSVISFTANSTIEMNDANTLFFEESFDLSNNAFGLSGFAFSMHTATSNTTTYSANNVEMYNEILTAPVIASNTVTVTSNTTVVQSGLKQIWIG